MPLGEKQVFGTRQTTTTRRPQQAHGWPGLRSASPTGSAFQLPGPTCRCFVAQSPKLAEKQQRYWAGLSCRLSKVSLAPPRLSRHEEVRLS